MCPVLQTAYVCSFTRTIEIEKYNFYVLTSALSFWGRLILYVHNIILPNSVSHTGQIKSEPDAI